MKQVSDWIFVLKLLISSQKAKGRPLYTAFVDFQKAFDSVDRPTLWAVLRNLGIKGQFLEALVSMYEHVRNTVKVNGTYSEIFECLVGVRQGDPLSPILFGLLIDRFHEYVEKRAPGKGFIFGVLLVAVLFFADDLLVVAQSLEELQLFLDLLNAFCSEIKLQVNVSKTFGVIFNASRKVCE